MKNIDRIKYGDDEPNTTHMQHTPGPWHVGLPTQPEAQGVYATTDMVAECWNTRNGSRDANAHLIAAAPDMLQALQAYFSDDYSIQKFRELARAAIAKATG